MKFKKITNKESGLTLVELMVAVGIFGILSVFVTGAFLNIMSIQKQAESRQQIMNDFRVALDLMGKEILDGSGFPDEPLGIDSLYFQTKVRHDMISRVIQYKVVDGTILKAQQDTQGECQVASGSFPNECFVPFTSENVDVENLTFYVNNFDEINDYGHPIITIVASGKVDINTGVSPTFKTSVSFSPRAQISPDYQPPTDTTDPEVEIQEIDGVPVNSFPSINSTLNDEITLSGRVRDPGASGIDTVYLRVHFDNAAGNQLYTANISSGFTAGSVNWFNWDFSNVDLYTAGDVNYIEVRAVDLSGNSGSDEVNVVSTAPPEAPNPPSLDTSYNCLATSTDVDYISIRMYSTDTDINYYEIKRDGSFLANESRSGNYTYFYDDGVTRGNSYTYTVRAVNSDWVFDVISSPVSGTESLGADYCSVPEINYFANEINCDSANSPAINLKARADTWLGRVARFEFLDEDTSTVLHYTNPPYTWWWSSSTYSWLHQDPSGLSTGEYEYEARICLGAEGSGGDCSSAVSPTSGPGDLDIEGDTCVPPDTEFWGAESGLHCDIDGLGNPSIRLDLTVKRDFPSGVRPFDTYVIYERAFGDTDWNEIETCDSLPTQTVYYDCVVKHFPRADAHYEYRVRALNSSSGWLGDPDIYDANIDGSMCDGSVGGWSDGPGGSIDANLVCTEEPADDYRETRINVTDDYDGRDPASIYRFYRCTSNVSAACDSTPFDQLTRTEQQAGDVAVDHGPSDGAVHWYGSEICNSDASICSGMTFDSVVISLEECDPQTPIVQTLNVEYSSSPSCYPPGSTNRDVELYATADNSSDLIEINIYRDGTPIATGLNQGQVFTDSVPTGSTYTYGFEACYPLATTPCGPVDDVLFTVVESICDPTTPTDLGGAVDCNDLGQIESVTLTTSGSQHNDGYTIERSNPAIPTFSCSVLPCIETFTPTIKSIDPKTYTYRSQSYRGALTSGWKYLTMDLDPAVYCTAPFDLTSSESYIVVTVTGGGQDRPSSATQIGVNPNVAFSSAVNFEVSDVEVNLRSPMTSVGVVESDVNVSLNRDVLYAPYDVNKPILSVTIPDKDYLGSNDSVHGADIVVKGTSEGFTAEYTVPLIIKWEAGSQF